MPSERSINSHTTVSNGADTASSTENNNKTGHYPQQQSARDTSEEEEELNRNGRLLNVPVHFLDDSVTVFPVHSKSLGSSLFKRVCEMLSLIEIDYFGLEYYDSSKKTQYWLDTEKAINHQLSLDMNSARFFFAVKFYPPDPSRLEDELTRYLFSLQIKKDLADGILQCNENTAALMASYIVQAEVGDFNSDEYEDQNYVTKFKLIPDQDAAFEWKVTENHKKHIGQSPAEADMNLLETARRCELYGVKLTAVTDHEGVPFNLSVSHAGLLIFQNKTKVNIFSWTKIRKLSFKRKRFLIKLHKEDYFGDVVEFYFITRNDCKNFWKKCVEQHTFFRCPIVRPAPRSKPLIFSRGSSFRYSGRTQQQLIDYVHKNLDKRSSFQRSSSWRNSGRRVNDHCGNLTPIQPILPISTPQLEHISSEPLSETDNDRQRSRSAMDYHHHHQQQRFQEKEANVNTDKPSLLPLTTTATSPVSAISYDSGNDLSGDRGEFVSPDSADSAKIKQEMEREVCSIMRELLNVECTFRKDFEIINIWFKENLNISDIQDQLLATIEPLLQAHEHFARKLDAFVASCESNTRSEPLSFCPSVNNVFTAVINLLPNYDNFYDCLPFTLDRLSYHFRYNREFERACREFEIRKGCYLPYTSFILKPAYHLRVYLNLFEQLFDCLQSSGNQNLFLFRNGLRTLRKFNNENNALLQTMLNSVILMEIQRDIIGLENVIPTCKTFIRLGCLSKLSKRGYQQRIFFLFHDMMFYCSRASSAQNHQFKIHGTISLKNIIVEEMEARAGVKFGFTIYAGDQALIVAAKSENERQIWISAIRAASNKYQKAINSDNENLNSISLCEEILEQIEQLISPKATSADEQFDLASTITAANSSAAAAAVASSSNHSRSNAMLHVCWHRNCSVSVDDYQLAFSFCLSGFLLRKFKNSNGWQRLWVVFTNFCLFFYKCSQDDFPLASLPLLGYQTSRATEADQVQTDLVFKLQFKTHVYFFRADNQYNFDRWLNAIGRATCL